MVGAGVMGLATAHALTRAGARVRVLEQFELGHARGSSHGSSRIFRLSYPEREWVELAQESLVAWRELEAETGETLLELSGLVEIVDSLEGSSARGLDACGVSWQPVDADQLRRRFGLALRDRALGVFQPEAGIVCADRARRALRGAADVATRTTVFELAAHDRGVAVSTSAGSIDADAVVVTAGAWARRLLAPLVELPLTVTRETVAYFEIDARRVVPSVIDLSAAPPGRAYYALSAPGVGLKVGIHHAGVPADPDAAGEPDVDVVTAATEWARGIFSLPAREPVRVETCLYTNSPDERFILERHGRIVVGSPCSGHGFKFAPIVGARLAALALEATA